VQRHRHEHVGPLQQRGTGARHVARQQGRTILAATVLQAQDQRPAAALVEQRRTRPAPRRRLPVTGGAQALPPPRLEAGKRQPAARATWLGDECDAGKTVGAELSERLYRTAASCTMRRQQQIEHGMRDGTLHDERKGCFFEKQKQKTFDRSGCGLAG
jgi:hypothetical protein